MVICVFSCQNSSRIETEISKIDLDLNIERFDQLFTERQLTALATFSDLVQRVRDNLHQRFCSQRTQNETLEIESA